MSPQSVETFYVPLPVLQNLCVLHYVNPLQKLLPTFCLWLGTPRNDPHLIFILNTFTNGLL